MSVRKRKWTTRKGEQREAWVLDYADAQGDRHIETFATKSAAKVREDEIGVSVRQGTHTPASKSVFVEKAAEDWLAHVEAEGRERSTVAQYRQHVRLHILPKLGKVRLAQLTTPRVESFKDELLGEISRPLAKKVLVSLKSLLRDAHRRGNVAQNVAASVKITMDKRSKKRLLVGTDIPTTAEIRSLLSVATGKQRALLAVAVFAGLRSSELRGLRWGDVELDKREIHVRQRADRYGKIGKPKSHAGERVVPIGPFVVNTLKEWKLACPNTKEGIVFPTGRGRIDHHANTLRALAPVQKLAGVVTAEGEPKYAWHAFRHFFASWCINRREDGGLELPPKVVQDRMGHASITLTMDTYGHLFPRSDDRAELAAAEAELLA